MLPAETWNSYEPPKRPASTPDPVAVPDVEAMPVHERDVLVAAVLRFMTDRGYVVTMPPHPEPVVLDGPSFGDYWTPDPEPVVAPLPSEAMEVTDVAVSAAQQAYWPAYSEAVRNAPSNRKGQGISSQDADAAGAAGMRAAITAALPHLRLVPEDDEDTVRVVEGPCSVILKGGHVHMVPAGKRMEFNLDEVAQIVRDHPTAATEDTVRVPREAVEAFMTDYAKGPSTDEATEAAHALFLRLGGHR